MLRIPGSLKVFIAVEPCDMRCGFNGLHQAVTSRLGEDPKSGSIFAFSNKRRSLLNVDGRIVIVALYRIHIVGVRGTFPSVHRNSVPLWS